MASRLVHNVPGETRDLGMKEPQWHSLILEGQVQVDTRHVGPKYVKEMLMKQARTTRPIGRRVPALGRWTFCGALDGQQLLVVEGSGCQLVFEDVDIDTLLYDRVRNNHKNNHQTPTTNKNKNKNTRNTSKNNTRNNTKDDTNNHEPRTMRPQPTTHNPPDNPEPTETTPNRSPLLPLLSPFPSPPFPSDPSNLLSSHTPPNHPHQPPPEHEHKHEHEHEHQHHTNTNQQQQQQQQQQHQHQHQHPSTAATTTAHGSNRLLARW